MEIIVLQHIKVEDPGYIKDLMLKDGVNLTTIELDEGEKIGKLIDPIEGSILKEIVSPCSGLLFTIREHPLVHKGSPLARMAEVGEM